jgi:uncharacterized protein (DUF1330 family)
MKAFLVTESEILDSSALAAYIPRVREALKATGGRPAVISSIGGRVVPLVEEPPRNLVVSEWPSLAAPSSLASINDEQAQ